MSDLFQAAGLEKGAPQPLADRLRPAKLSEVVGQAQILGPDGTLTRMLRSGRITSMILWGPPGSGKTTVARLIATETQLDFEQISAIFSGVQDLRKAFDRAKARRAQGSGRCFSSTRFIVSTGRNRIPSCRTWKTEQSR